jgi:hypothetical protein
MDAACAPARTRPGLELADVVRAHGDAFVRGRPLWPEQRAALRDIERCRTAALGGHLDVCTACSDERPSYNSCRNRHCPKCQALAQARWIERRLERLLPVHYFHVVFTLPAELRRVTKRHRRAMFDMLFSNAAETLLALGRDDERMGAELGITMVLHTWTRELLFHPHVHAIVTGGGLTKDGARWVSTKKDFLFPVHVMGALFRGKMLDALERAHAEGRIDLGAVDLMALRKKRWIVYAKRPFGGPEQVIRYLGRYTHRVGIANQRLAAMDERGVTFRTKNGRTVTVSGEQMLARFVEHVLPRGFVKIRHYGLHSAKHATTTLTATRALLTSDRSTHAVVKPVAQDWRDIFLRVTGIDVRACLHCGAFAVVRHALPSLRSRAPPEAA